MACLICSGLAPLIVFEDEHPKTNRMQHPMSGSRRDRPFENPVVEIMASFDFSSG
jgi:hypothetical protein